MRRLTLRMGGLLFPVPMTMGEVEKGHLLRASLEAIAFATKQNLLQLEQIAGSKAAGICVGGGFSRSHLYAYILANVLDRPIRVSTTPDVSSLGAAICAVGNLNGRNLTAIHRMRAEFRLVEPGQAAAEEYNHYYEKWVTLSERMNRFSEAMF
jgi:sugar (pentulose or hexulose) kinase